MTTRIRTLALAAAGLALAGCHGARSWGSGGTAVMHDASGRTLGTLQLQHTNNGVRIVGDLANLTPGVHGIHFHQVGKCEGPDFASAGGHLNPSSRHHGLKNPAGPHDGDLPNLVVPAGGALLVEILDERVSLDNGLVNGLFDTDGTALVIHANEDDQMTDPSGNSGARIACGVVTRS